MTYFSRKPNNLPTNFLRDPKNLCRLMAVSCVNNEENIVFV